MTAEVAVLNKTGVAIAADSAVTTGFPGKEKIFTTANKIFTLSKFQPVGVMINGHVEHLGIPWEVIIKDFRHRLGSQKFGDLREYVDLFLKAITEKRLLSSDGQIVSVLVNTLSTMGELENRLAGKSMPWRSADIKKTLEKMLEDANEREFIPGFESISDRKFTAEYGAIIDDVSTNEEHTDKKIPTVCKVLFRRVVLAAMSHQMASQFSTGLVITGYGAENLVPKLYEISIDGAFLDQVRLFDVGNLDVAKDAAAIAPFAQDDIVNSFLNGIDRKFEIFNAGFFAHSIELIADEILHSHTNLSQDERLVATQLVRKKIGEAFADIREENDTFSQQEFRQPVLDVLRTAPKEVLAELAESLVSITSLRQRVSGDLETVGGPVDVALISKGEGFIWIKRKHYFETELNPHYTTNYFREV
jgi:hypothetical protein